MKYRNVETDSTEFLESNHSNEKLKGAVSRQSSSFCLILSIARPQSLRNLKKAKKSHVNDKIRDLRQTNMSPEHYF